MKRISVLLSVISCLSLLSLKTKAEGDTVSRLTLKGYVDAYYAHYTDSVGSSNFQKFPTVSPHSDNIGLNVALLDCKYEGKNVRAHVAFHYGDIPNSTWSPALPNIARAHAGVRLAKGLWLDAGIFRTHFGTELLYPNENITSSVSVGTFYEPYYEGGARLEYTPNDKLSIDLYVLNGYALYEDNNKKKSVGILASYAFSDNFNINYSNYIGDDAPKGADTISHLRIHQNFYFNATIGKLLVQAGGDYCIQQHADITNPNNAGTMYSALLTLKFQALKKLAVYARGEVFNDENGYMSTLFADATGKFTGYKLWGATAGLEFKPFDNGYIRVEGRQLQMDDNQKIFINEETHTATATRYEMMATMGVSFDILKRITKK